MSVEEVWVDDFDAWRKQARAVLGAGRSPDDVRFHSSTQETQPLLPLGDPDIAAIKSSPNVGVPPDFLPFAKTVACHREPGRWDLLYRILWRLTHGEHELLRDHSDPLVRRARLMEKAVDRDIHKMRAFVRFRQTPDGAFIAWYKPEHLIVRANAPFFERRFGSMRWAILTPDESVYWDTKRLRFGPGLPRDVAPPDDQMEDLWLTYYSSIFNPARINIPAMINEMPVRHWHTLPEAKIIGSLVRNADSRVGLMVQKTPTSARPFVPGGATWQQLADAAKGCRGCELCEHATQTVFGEGPAGAKILMVGEQPGDQEDFAGKPFVGPAGQVFNRALADADVDRGQLYVTNAVKHFYFEERGKRRIHKKPKGTHISACRPWLEAEIESVRPDTIVCLGATAAQSLLGRDVRIHADRGRWLDNRWAKQLLVTIHPSALLRLPDPSGFDAEYARFVADLRMVKTSA